MEPVIWWEISLEWPPNYYHNNLKPLSSTARVTLSPWLLKILLHVVNYYVTLWILWGKFVFSLSVYQSRKIFLGRMKEFFKGNFDLDIDKFSVLDKLCPTRWTAHAIVFKRSVLLFSKDHWQLLFAIEIIEWMSKCLKEPLEAKIRSRIIGCKAQMKMFNFFFGLCLGQRKEVLGQRH